MTLREFLRADLWDQWDSIETDQKKRLPPPLRFKPYPADAELIDLVRPDAFTVGTMPLVEAIRRRRSRRRFTEAALSFEELSFLLWATQGLSGPQPTPSDGTTEGRSLRTVPSGGARHPFETYLLVNRVAGLEPALYRYLPQSHRLCHLRDRSAIADLAEEAWAVRQALRECAVVFIWTAVPYRMEWLFGRLSHKIIAMDAGHLCQNLYLASEAIGAGTCAFGWYDQARVDAMVQADGTDEFSVYMAAVGKIEQQPEISPTPPCCG